MRFLTILAATAAVTLTFSACKRSEKSAPPVAATQSSSPEIVATVHAADPKTAPQLLRGFHPVEQNAWRWTFQKFAVALKPPANGESAGANLVVRFAVPDPVIAKLGTVTLTPSINGEALPGLTVSKAGDQTYSQGVPPRLLKGDSVTVEFALDKVMAAGTIDSRELGVVFSSASLEGR
jgi:hypothetical protein